MHLYIHGNCQAPALASMIGEAFPDWRIEAFEVFASPILDRLDAYYENVRRADLILMQPIHDGYRNREDLSSSFIRANARPDATVIVFPSLHFTGQLMGIRSLGVPGFGMEYHDVAFFDCYARGLNLADIIPKILHPDFYTPEQISQEISLSIAESETREAIDQINLPISGYLRENALQEQLFHVINHPYRPVLAHIANSFFNRIGISARISDAGPDFLPIPHIPCHPSVIKMLKLHQDSGGERSDVDAEYVLHDQRYRPFDYYRALSKFITRYSRNEVRELLDRSESVRSFLARIPQLKYIEITAPSPSLAESVSARPTLLRWSPMRVDYQKRKSSDEAGDTREKRLALITVQAHGGETIAARAELDKLVSETGSAVVFDDYMFENLVAVAVACEQFDVAIRILEMRFGEHWCEGMGIVADKAMGPGVRWTVLGDSVCRFDFHESLFQTDHTLENLLFWVRSLSLYYYYTRLQDRPTGAVDISLFDVGLGPGLSFCDNKPQHFLVPDPGFLCSRGYELVRQILDEHFVPWSDRSPVAFWRGATTGHHGGDWKSLPRVILCEIARSAKSDGLVDAGISSIVQMPEHWVLAIAQSGLVRNPVLRTEYMKFKYQIDIDGNTNAWPGLFERLYTGSPVLKVASPFDYEQWYYDRLVPWWNYVPVASDMSDLIEKIKWLMDHDQVAMLIGERGRALATALAQPSEIANATGTIMAALQHFADRPFATLGGDHKSLQNIRLIAGWRHSAKAELQMLAIESRLEVDCPCVRGDLNMHMALHLPSAAVPPARLAIIVNGEIIYDGVVEIASVLELRIAEHVRKRANPMSVTLLHPNAQSTSAVAESVDMQPVAFVVDEIAIRVAR
jgi:hypothetical protein